MVDLKDKIRKIIEVILIVAIVGLSVAIFIFRDKIQNVSEVGYFGLIVLCFLANATVLLPAPSLMIAASCALIMNPWLVALCAALGSTLGELIGYAFGTVTKDLSPKFQKIVDKLTSKIHSPIILVFVLAALPLPLFDVVGIYSGGSKMNLVKFFLACFLGKFVKMLVYTRIYDILSWASSRVPGLEGLVK